MMVMATILAIGIILAQAAAVWGFLRFVKSFGAYTESQQQMTNALLYTHESNMLVHQANLRVLGELQKLHERKQEVA